MNFSELSSKRYASGKNADVFITGITYGDSHSIRMYCGDCNDCNCNCDCNCYNSYQYDNSSELLELLELP